MSMFSDISSGTICTREDLERTMVIFGLDFEKKRYSISEDSSQGIWDNCRKDALEILLQADVHLSALRHHCPEVNSEVEDMEN